MTETKRPLKVFLCHAHSDKDTVKALYDRLTQDGVDAWLDKEKLLGGADWDYEIRNAVRGSDIVIVCHSKQFNQRGYRQKEVKIALEEADLLPKGEIFIIPVRLEECEVLDDLKRWHWVDLFEDNGYENLMRALRARANKIGATLQIKRSWFAQITAPRFKLQESAENKKAEEPKNETIDEKKDDLDDLHSLSDDVAPAHDNFPDDWVSQWQPSFENETAKTHDEQDTKEQIVESSRRDLEREVGEIVREYKHQTDEINRQYQWRKFTRGIRYRLKLISIYRVPILILLLGIAVIIPLSIDLYNNFPELTQAVNNLPTNIVTSILPSQTPMPNLLLTKLYTPTPTRTYLPTWTLSFTPTVTFTPTPIPTTGILLQEDFEDNKADRWVPSYAKLSIEQEPGGNHYLSASGTENMYAWISYGDKNSKWTDYVFESRIKFVEGPHNLSMWVRADDILAYYSLLIYSGIYRFGQHSTDYTDWTAIDKWLNSELPRSFEQGEWYTIRVEIKGDTISAYVDNTYLGDAKFSLPPVNKQGGIGFGFDGGEVMNFDDIRVWSLK